MMDAQTEMLAEMLLTPAQRRILKVLENIGLNVIENDDDAEMWLGPLETMLDDLYYHDFFGTEGQNDPRGDMRDERGWSLHSRVAGVDE